MVYCNLIQAKNSSAIYSFGATTSDITGEVEFFSAPEKPKILKQPNIKSVPINALMKMAAKYADEFGKGSFPQKISYER
jgi:hypothetical protein